MVVARRATIKHPMIMKAITQKDYKQVIREFKHLAAKRAVFCKNLKERCICVQEFDIAAALRTAQKGFELIASRNPKP